MIRNLSSLLTASLLFAAPILAEEKEHPAEVQVEVILKEGDKVLEKASLDTDLVDGGTEFGGTVAIKSPEGGRWVIRFNARLGNETTPEDRREFNVSVSDAEQLRENLREGTRTFWPVELYDANRIWRGPGTYRIAGQNGWVLSVKVADTAALRKPPAALNR